MNRVEVKWRKIKETPSIFGGMGGGNYVLSNKDIMISYQPNIRDNIFEDIGTMLTGDDTKSDETALMFDENGKDVWCVLKGDWRKDYEKLFPDKKKCIAFYKKMKPKHGFDKWSTDDE